MFIENNALGIMKKELKDEQFLIIPKTISEEFQEEDGSQKIINIDDDLYKSQQDKKDDENKENKSQWALMK